MKPILIFLLMFFSTFLSYGQKTYHVSKLQAATWDKNNEKWVWDEEKATDMIVTMVGNIISISNTAKTVIKTYDIINRNNNGSDEKTFWNAVDQDGTNLTFIYSKQNNSNKQSIILTYKTQLVVYRFDE